MAGVDEALREIKREKMMTTEELQAAMTTDIDIRDRIKRNSALYMEIRERSERLMIPIGIDLMEIRHCKLWAEWLDEQDAPFRSFRDWCNRDCQIPESTVYAIIRIMEYLSSVPHEELTELGMARCVSLSQLAAHKPEALCSFLALAKDLTAQDLGQKVALELLDCKARAGRDRGSMRVFHFRVPKAMEQVCREAIMKAGSLESLCVAYMAMAKAPSANASNGRCLEKGCAFPSDSTGYCHQHFARNHQDRSYAGSSLQAAARA